MASVKAPKKAPKPNPAGEDFPPIASRNPKAILTRYNERDKPKPVIAVDIETHGLGGAFAGGAYQAEDEEKPTPFYTIDEWIAALFSERYRGYIWFAHNGGEYDYKYLISALLAKCDSVPQMTLKPIIQGNSRVIGFKITYREHVYELRDSYALMPSSLRKLTSSLAPHLPKGEFDHNNTVFDIRNPVHYAYLERDVMGLLAVIQAFKEILAEYFHVAPAWTAAATALKAWRATIPREKAYFRYSKRVREYCRQAYVGGLVALRDTLVHEDVLGIDVNAMYPFVMMKGVPYGLATYTNNYQASMPGIYHVVVTVPDDVGYPTAPHKDKAGVVWASGTFDTYMCSHELEDIKQDGVIWRVIDGYAFDRIEYPFDDFIKKCERLELEHGRGSAIYDVVKILRNGLYGKFGAREESSEYVLTSGVPDDSYIPVVDEVTGDIVDNLWMRPKELDVPYLHPEWAGWITASARIVNRGIARDVGYEHWLYADTDSNKFARAPLLAAIERGALTIGDKYGMVKIDGEYAQFQAGGPKVYWGIEYDGGVIMRAKGMPASLLALGDLQRAISHNEIVTHSYTGMNGTLQMLRRGKPASEAKTRSYPLLTNSRGWRVDDARRVRPIHIIEVSDDIMKVQKGA